MGVPHPCKVSQGGASVVVNTENLEKTRREPPGENTPVIEQAGNVSTQIKFIQIKKWFNYQNKMIRSSSAGLVYNIQGYEQSMGMEQRLTVI